MNNPKPRKKIFHKRAELVPDNLIFTKNKCSDNARKVLTDIEKISIELWFDKHYHNRCQHGDKDGEREGIDNESVQSLVLEAMKHLLLYSAYVTGFTFINHEPKNYRAVRVVLKTPSNGTMLNVVIEVHYLSMNNYEITVKTAMCTDNFMTSDGQYSIEIEDVSSTLYKNNRGKNVEIYSF